MTEYPRNALVPAAAPANSPSAPRSPRARILGCEFDRLDMQETLDRVEEIIARGRPSQHVAVSATNFAELMDDDRVREVVKGAAIVSADGQGIVWASRLLGDPLPERVNAMDLMERLFALAAEKGYRVYILGARERVLEHAVERLRARYPGLVIAGYRHGYFTDVENDVVVSAIREARPDMLFVAISSPKKETWLAEHRDALGVPFVMGVGGAIDVVAGRTRRAPLLVQKAGFEWVFRMIQEPRRLGRRFLAGNAKFVYLVGKQALARRSRSGG